MEIYRNRHRWRILLAVMGMIIVIITSIYSNYLAKNLAEKEKKSVNLLSIAIPKILNTEDMDEDLSLPSAIVENNTVPIILEDEKGDLKGYNYGDEKFNDQEFLARKIEEYKKRGVNPIVGEGYAKNIWFENSKLYDNIRLYPIIQILLVAIFILLGYLVFSASRREEQNRVWAGMAKETAHQLGTPISAILAWLEHLKIDENTTPSQMEIIGELENDVDRLNLVADRFSKIGSSPILAPSNVYEMLQESKIYMEKRAPRKVKFLFPEGGNPLRVNVNRHLFDWVLENLMRNALDAMEGKGEIKAQVVDEGNFVTIELSDTGKGIPDSKYKTVFKPGFSTKTRGWGLGLSLAKRIIEEYHNGKIYVKQSKVGEGTTFAITLPKAEE